MNRTPLRFIENRLDLPDAERVQIHQTIASAEEELAVLQRRLDQEMLQCNIPETLNFQLLSKLDSLEELVRSQKSALSSFLDFPPEIMSEIFIFAIPTRTLDIGLCGHLYHHPYIITHALSQTCRRWRNIALSTPQLWTSIPPSILSDDHQNGPKCERHLSLVRMFLHRSLDLPIHVALFDKHKPSYLRSADAYPVVYLLTEQSSRWGSAILHLWYKPISNLLPSLPILKALNARDGFCLTSGTKSQSNATALRLTELIYDSMPREIDPVIMSTRATLSSFTGRPRNYISLKPLRPYLQSLTLRGPVDGSEMELLVFAQLRSLCVANTNYSKVAQLAFGIRDTGRTALGYISTPTLEELEIRGHPRVPGANQVINDLLATTLPQSSVLRSLIFHLRGLDAVELSRLLAVTPLLESLDVWDTPSTTFAALIRRSESTPHGSTNPLVPRLRYLIIRDFTDLDSLLLRDLHKSRQLEDSPGLLGDTLSQVLKIRLRFRTTRACSKAVERWIGAQMGGLVPGSEATHLLGWGSYLIKQFLSRVPGEAEKFGVSFHFLRYHIHRSYHGLPANWKEELLEEGPLCGKPRN